MTDTPTPTPTDLPHLSGDALIALYRTCTSHALLAAINTELDQRKPYPWCYDRLRCVARGYCPKNPSCGD